MTLKYVNTYMHFVCENILMLNGLIVQIVGVIILNVNDLIIVIVN